MYCWSVQSIVNWSHLCREASELLGNRYAHFGKLNSIEKTAYILGSGLWEYEFDSLVKNML